MCTYTYAYMYKRICTCKHICTYMYAYMYIHVCIHIRTYMYEYTIMCPYIHMCIHEYRTYINDCTAMCCLRVGGMSRKASKSFY